MVLLFAKDFGRRALAPGIFINLWLIHNKNQNRIKFLLDTCSVFVLLSWVRTYGHFKMHKLNTKKLEAKGYGWAGKPKYSSLIWAVMTVSKRFAVNADIIGMSSHQFIYISLICASFVLMNLKRAWNASSGIVRGGLKLRCRVMLRPKDFKAG